ncbi:MAG: gamma-glutamyltransferase, partial [Planctomycetota bacterium]
GLTLQVVEPHLNGPAGEFPAIFHSAATGRTEVLCAQGTAPEGATIAHYRSEGLDLVPGSGLLATVIPGAWDGWMLLLRDHGTMRLRDVMEPALAYAEKGHPILPRVCDAIAGLSEFFETEWPTSFATWCPGGKAPEPGALFANPDLAATWRRLLSEAEAKEGREAQIEAARLAWREGFVAEAVDAYLRDAEVMDASGAAHRGVLTADDMAGWEATYEAPQLFDYHGRTIAKTGPWGQGPVLQQALSLLAGYDLASMDPNGAEFVHLVIEAMKLAYADREAFYGDPDHVEVPLEVLLSQAHAASRRTLIGDAASMEQRPSRLPGFEPLADAAIDRAARLTADGVAPSAGEPTMAHLSDRRGDTVHLD